MTPKKASRRATAYSVGVLDAIFSISPVKRPSSADSKKSPEHRIQVRCNGRRGSPLDEKVIQFSPPEDDSESSGVTTSTGKSRHGSFFSKIRSRSSSSTKPAKQRQSRDKRSPKKQAYYRERSYESDNDSVISIPAEKPLKAASKLRKRPGQQKKAQREDRTSDTNPEPQPNKIHPLLHHPSAYPGGFRTMQQSYEAAPFMVPASAPQAQHLVPPHHPTAVPWVPPTPVASYAEQLQHVQRRINATTAQIHGNPANMRLKDHLNALQGELNNIMNIAITHASRKEETLAPKSEQEQRPTTNFTNTGDKKGDSSLKQDHEEDMSLRHHLCSNCHKVRSAKYHRLHPLGDSQVPVHNLCEGCKGSKPDFLTNFHFCSGCGVVRSKAFHRKVSDGTSPDEPNYCGKCVARVSKANRLVESTVVNENPHTLVEKSLLLMADESEDRYATRDPASSDRALPGKSSVVAVPAQALSGSVVSTCSSETRNDTPSTSKAASVLIDNIEAPALTSYYYPARAHSSDYRRAQRSQASRMSESPGSSKKVPAYRAPYIRDDASEPLSPYSVQSSHHPDSNPPCPLEANDKSRRRSDCSSGTGYQAESCDSSSSKSTSERSDNTPKYWNGAFSRRHETTMFVKTDINYPPGFDAPLSSSCKSFHADESCDQTRYSRGAFKDHSPLGSAGLSWTSTNGYHSPPHSPPWNPQSDYYTSNLHEKSQPNYKRRTSMFSNFNQPNRSADDFRKPSPTTSHFSCPSPFYRSKWHHNPEPIIEEPISPPSSPVLSPMLLEFNVSDSTDSE